MKSEKSYLLVKPQLPSLDISAISRQSWNSISVDIFKASTRRPWAGMQSDQRRSAFVKGMLRNRRFFSVDQNFFAIRASKRRYFQSVAPRIKARFHSASDDGSCGLTST